VIIPTKQQHLSDLSVNLYGNDRGTKQLDDVESATKMIAGEQEPGGVTKCSSYSMFKFILYSIVTETELKIPPSDNDTGVL
jgi:hypothetical protein